MKELHFTAKMAAWIDDNGSKKLVIHTMQDGSPAKVVVSFGDTQHDLLTREVDAPCA